MHVIKVKDLKSAAPTNGKTRRGRVSLSPVEIGSLRSTIVTFLDNVADRTTESGKPVLLV